MTDNELAVLRVIMHNGPIKYGLLSSHRAIYYMEDGVPPSEYLDPVLKRLAHRGWIETQDELAGGSRSRERRRISFPILTGHGN